jgi:hypothetical protein
VVDFIGFHQIDGGSNAGLEKPFESLLVVTRIPVTCVSSAEKQIFDDSLTGSAKRF